MPFGLSGAPALGSRDYIMNSVCGDLPFVTTYLDDLLVHSATKEDHLQHLRTPFQKLSGAGLTFQGSKCHIGLSQVTYLGHVFAAEGMGPDPQKVSAVGDWLIPKILLLFEVSWDLHCIIIDIFHVLQILQLHFTT